jgi:hypothetical protein
MKTDTGMLEMQMERSREVSFLVLMRVLIVKNMGMMGAPGNPPVSVTIIGARMYR